MRAYVGLTDWDWFQFLRAQRDVDEVNFWRPSNTRSVSMAPGTPFIFKLRQDRGGAIVGFGHFAGFSAPPMWVAWEAFERKNGAASFEDLHRMLSKIRSTHGHQSDPAGNYRIGCLMLSQPVFFERADWIVPPSDWPRTGLMSGKSIDIRAGEGERVWRECLSRARSLPRSPAERESVHEPGRGRYGAPTLVRPRLGQGAFRMLVTDAYGGACAVTNEHALPVLEAAHIKPYTDDGPHEVGNGLLLRTDVHRLFDKGYVTVDPADYRFVVSKRLEDDYNNGRVYYGMHGQTIHLPQDRASYPDPKYLEWHAAMRFRG